MAFDSAIKTMEPAAQRLPLTLRGSPQFPEVAGALPPSSIDTMDLAVHAVRENADLWAALPAGDRVDILDRMIHDMTGVVERWVCSCMDNKGFGPGEAGVEEYLSGPDPIIRNMRLLRQSLVDIDKRGAPRIPGPVTTLPNGQVCANIFPADIYDRAMFNGVTMDVWMEPGVTVENLVETLAVAYARCTPPSPGKVCLVLAAGNASAIGPMDALYKLFIENQAVVYKSHPVNACLGPLVEEGFQALVERGFLRVVHGGAAEGAYLCQHPGIDEIHMTGSDKTFDAIVFGRGAEGAQRKAERRPKLEKRVSAELGNITPVIVVPGPWTRADIAYHAANLATMQTTNAGFFCVTSRVIIQHAGWWQRDVLLDAVGRVLAQTRRRKAYYPGAAERHAAFLAEHPNAELYGAPEDDGRLPWMLVRGLDPHASDDICYTTESFCSQFAETGIEAASVPEFIDRAVEFANTKLWGSLAATIIVHPKSLQDPATAQAFERAITNLRYGTIAVNHWNLLSFVLAAAPWGAFPGNDMYDIGSGVGFVHNTYMFSRAQKTVLRAPFRAWPSPPWFVTFKNGEEVAKGITYLDANPGARQLAKVAWQALKG